MRHNCCILTQEVYKWKARFCLDGSCQVFGWDYNKTYAPVADWIIIWSILVLAIINGWESLQINYVLAYLQAPVKQDMYMEIPKGCKVNAKGDYVMQILQNIYGQKQAGCVWFLHLVKKLKSIGFIQLTTSPCIFIRKNCIYVLYTDNALLTSPQCAKLLKVVEDMKAEGLKITVKGTIANFLRVNIKRDRHGHIHLMQPSSLTASSRSSTLMEKR